MGIDLERDVEIGDFRIEKRLGAGGMGIVYQARQISLNRTVALKILGNALTGSAEMARFRREAQAAAKLEHPGVARIYFVGQTERLCYLAMELVNGEALQTLISRLRTRPDADAGIDAMLSTQPSEPVAETVTRFDVSVETLPDGAPPTPVKQHDSGLPESTQRLVVSTAYIRRCCEIVREAALVLDYAHKQGVVHRDIKPANLMLDISGHVHVIDFGIARFFEDATLTYSGQLVGTPMFMAPEQVTGRYEPDPRTDVYALGLVLYELLCLRPPLQAPNREELLRRIIAKPLYPLSRANRTVPAGLEAVVHKATAKDRDERYATAKEFAEDMDRYLSNQSVLAPPYRYRVDEGEIRANRPGWISVASVLFSCLGIVILWATILVGVQYLETQFALKDARDIGIGFGIAVLLLSTAYGIATARKWARIVAVIFGPGITVYLLYFFFNMPQFLSLSGRRLLLSEIAADCLLFLVCFAFFFTSYKLLTREARDWFGLAARIRAEHRRAEPA